MIACAASPVGATNVQSLVTEAALEHLQAQARQLRLLEPRFRLEAQPRDGSPATRACARAVQIETLSDRHPARMRFAAVCNAEPAWRTEYVVRAAVSAQVLVARVDIPAHQPIAAEQLELRRRDLSVPLAAVSYVEEAEGLASRRALRSGQIVDRRWLIQPLLVRRGERISIVAHSAGVQANVAGIAMDDARRGETLRVRNVASGKIIRTRVIGKGAVEPISMSNSSASE